MSKTQREILVRNLRLDRLAEDLPDNVFPVYVDVALARSPTEDNYLSDMDGNQVREPAYPMDVKVAAETPYISKTRVYLENPVKFPKDGQPSWTFESFAGYLADIADLVETVDASARNRIYLEGMELCEVPSEYVFENEAGERRVTKELYTDQAGEPVALATFDKRPRISDKQVREQLGAAAAGNVIKPLRLTDVMLVWAKPHRGSNKTTAESTRRKYFTEAQAKQWNRPQQAPKEVSNLTWEVIETYLPELGQTEFAAEVEFTGDTDTDKSFLEHDVRFLSDGKPGADSDGQGGQQEPIPDGGDD